MKAPSRAQHPDSNPPHAPSEESKAGSGPASAGLSALFLGLSLFVGEAEKAQAQQGPTGPDRPAPQAHEPRSFPVLQGLVNDDVIREPGQIVPVQNEAAPAQAAEAPIRKGRFRDLDDDQPEREVKQSQLEVKEQLVAVYAALVGKSVDETKAAVGGLPIEDVYALIIQRAELQLQDVKERYYANIEEARLIREETNELRTLAKTVISIGAKLGLEAIQDAPSPIDLQRRVEELRQPQEESLLMTGLKVVGAVGLTALALVGKTWATGRWNRGTLVRLWGELKGGLTWQDSSNIDVSKVSSVALDLDGVRKCNALEGVRLPSKLPAQLAKVGLQLRVVVHGTLLDYDEGVARFGDVVAVDVGVKSDPTQKKGLEVLSSAMSYRFLESNPDARSLADAAIKNAVTRLLREDVAEASGGRATHALKEYTEIFRDWTKSLGVQEAAFFARYLQAMALPKEMRALFIQTERSRVKAAASTEQPDSNLDDLCRRLAEMKRVLDSTTPNTKECQILTKLLQGICNDCSKDLGGLEVWYEENDPSNWLLVTKKLIKELSSQIAAMPPVKSGIFG